jgi:hypothetical protein
MDTIKRIRKYKKRYGITNGPSFLGFHFGLRSWYYSKPTGRRFWGFYKLTDNQGTTTIK